MKKIIYFSLLVCILCGAFQLFASASELDISDSLLPYVDGEINKITNGDIENYTSDIANGKGNIFSDMKESVKHLAPDFKKSFFTLLCALILSGVISSLKSSFSDNDDVCGLAGVVVCSILLFSLMQTAFDLVKLCLQSSITFMTALLGITCTIQGLSGNVGTAHLSLSTLSVVLFGIQSVLSYVLFPMMCAMFGITVANTVKESTELTEISSAVKKTCVFILTACGFICSLFFTVGTAFSSLTEGALKKGVKFAAGSFIPIVGSSLSDAYDAVYFSLSSLKVTAGASGIVVLLLTFAPPVLCLCGIKAMLYACEIISQSLSLKRQVRLMNTCGDILSVMIALCCFSFVVFSVFCGAFMKVSL